VHPLDLHKLSWNDFVANAVFWVIDIVVISILVPIFARYLDNSKWSLARIEIPAIAARYLDDVNSNFALVASTISSARDSLAEAAARDDKWWTTEGLRKLRLGVFREFAKAVEHLDTNLDESRNRYLQELQLLTPAFNSELVTLAVDYYRAIVPPQAFVLGFLKLWALELASGEPPTVEQVRDRFDMNLARHQTLYSNCEGILEKLCDAGGLKTREDGTNQLIIGEPRGRIGPLTLYPNHPTVVASFERIRELLAIPMVRPAFDHTTGEGEVNPGS
jgi:hypothetical protein